MTAVRQARSAARPQRAPAWPGHPARPDPGVRPEPRPAPARQPGRPAPGHAAPRRPAPRRRLSRQARRRRARFLLVSAGVLVAVGMFAVVGSHVVLAQRQFRLDQMQQDLAKAKISSSQLQLQVAQLQAPSRIVSVARKRLHMVTPPKVVYLTPGTTATGPKVSGTPAAPAAPSPAPAQ